MKELFFTLADHAGAALRGNEVLLLNFSGEVTDFVRFNHSQVRQPMTVRQAYLAIALVDGRRRNEIVIPLTGLPEQDREAVTASVRSLRDELGQLPEDPYLLYSNEPSRSERIDAGALPTAEAAIDDIVSAGRGTDLVGLLASGPILRGFASSLGARHWHEVDAFLLDWSLYHSGDKAVKSAWSGNTWDRTELQRRVEHARGELEHLAKPARTIEPGEYRTYLAPAALDELLWMLNWSGVSEKAQRTKQSCIQKLVDGQAALSPLLNIAEDVAGGLAPAFDEAGFTRAPRVDLVRGGRHRGSMVSPRTAAEYGIPSNGAGEDEGMSAMAIDGGTLAEADAVRALDKGLYVGNLHYLNFSDRANGRVTGMTRFATFWVEEGRIVAPVNVMRWDDTLYRMVGEQLEALTDRPQWILDNRTYGQRSVQTSRVPGALVRKMAFTL
jgi:predicted Zn-dependent protease